MHDLAQMAEGLGFDSFWRVDHPMIGHDCWTTLAAVAAVTRTIRLGTHVSCVAYRTPALLARMAADIDAISNGRLVLGLGSGDMPREFQQLGLAYPTIQERQAALEEYHLSRCRIARSPDEWRGTDYDGTRLGVV